MSRTRSLIVAILCLIMSILIALYYETGTSNTQIAENKPQQQAHGKANPEHPKQLTDKLIPTEVKQVFECRDYQRAIKAHNRRLQRFISLKATGWYFDGYSKMQIAETLAVNFEFDVAFGWYRQINRLSINHPKHADLISRINNLNTQDIFSPEGNGRLFYLGAFLAGDDIADKINFPELQEFHLNNDIYKAIASGELDKAKDLLERLRLIRHHELFFEHPALNLSNLYNLIKRSEGEKQMMLDALFFSGILHTNNDSVTQILTGMGKQDYLDFVEPPPGELQTNNDIQEKINNIKQRIAEFQPDIAMCDTVQQQQFTNVKDIKLPKDQVVKQLGEQWAGVLFFTCPGQQFFENIALFNHLASKVDFEFSHIRSAEQLLAGESSLLRIKEQLTALQVSNFENMLIFRIKKTTSDEIQSLIDRDILVTSLSILRLANLIPFAEREQLLLKNRRVLAADPLAISAIGAASIDLHEEKQNIQLLVQNNFPLKLEPSGLDPLWMILNYYQANSPTKIVHGASLEALIPLTKFNDIHVDAMYKIKLNNPDLYDQLIERFPQLNFPAPEQLVEIQCEKLAD